MFLAGLALKSTLVLACAWSITLLLRGRSAAARHLVWTAASAAVLILPLLSVSLPAWHLPLPPAVNSPATFQVNGVAGALPSEPGAPAAAVTHPQKSDPRRPTDWTTVAVLIWTAGSLFALVQMLAAWVAVGRLRRAATPLVDDGFCEALARTLEMRQPVEILEIQQGSMPMTSGIFRSAILLPADAWQWSQERRRVVLLHELAHVRRGDVATHVLGRLALIAYWWNPAAWFAWREFVKERERAADDLVLNTGTPATDYARHLLDVARGMQVAPATGWAAVAMARQSQLETRLRAILASGINRTATGRASLVAAAVLALALIAPLAAIRAQEVKVVAVPADVAASIRAARSQKNYQMLEDSAKAAVEARQFDSAEKLLEAAVAIRGEAAGTASREYGVGWLNLAALQQRRHESESAGAAYAKAAAILGEDPKAAEALIHLGTAALIKKNYAQANEYFQHAQRLDAGAAGLALMWSAVVMETQKNFDEADALFRRAVAQQDPQSAEAATVRQVYHNFLNAQGRAAEAAALESSTIAPSTAHTELPAGVYRIGGGVQAPKVLQKVEPEYTEEARAARLTGVETLFVQIGTDGLAHNIQVLRGLGLGLDDNGVDAISQWHFQPGKKDGQAVPVAATIEIHFRLL